MAKDGIFSSTSDFDCRYYSDYDALAEYLGHWRAIQPNGKIGFVSGVWDLIHLGHMAYIEKAHENVDLLVVGVDTDELTRSRKKKGEIERPVVPFEERVRIVSFLRAVDLVTVVDADFIRVLAAIRPDILVFSKTTKDLTEEKRAEYNQYVPPGGIVILDAQAPPDKVSTTARVRSMLMMGLSMAKVAMHESVDNVFKSLEEGL